VKSQVPYKTKKLAHIAKQWQIGEIIPVKKLSKAIKRLLRPSIDKEKKV
jgi:hypothetical protein|tara:strand:+ start:301 stop:447 length:147 start_codon:yes stop_codon:yes gene_type:complete